MTTGHAPGARHYRVPRPAGADLCRSAWLTGPGWPSTHTADLETATPGDSPPAVQASWGRHD
jgi:hypothetical protein